MTADLSLFVLCHGGGSSSFHERGVDVFTPTPVVFVLWQRPVRVAPFLKLRSEKKLGCGIRRDGALQRPAGCEVDGDNTAVTVSEQEQSHFSAFHARTLLCLRSAWET